MKQEFDKKNISLGDIPEQMNQKNAYVSDFGIGKKEYEKRLAKTPAKLRQNKFSDILMHKTKQTLFDYKEQKLEKSSWQNPKISK